MIEKIAKICWNDYMWSKPSGTNGKSPSASAHENSYGYGHEEWVLDKSRVINGFHYGFLQPLNLKTDRHVGNKYKIWLYSITERQKLLIGCIENAICISQDESKDIYKVYKKKGWLNQMIEELERAGINSKALKNTPDYIYFNIKFKIGSIKLYDEFRKISSKDKNLTTTRYKLLNKVAEFKFEKIKERGSESYLRNAVSETTVDQYHVKIQNALAKLLAKDGNFKNIKIESNNIDVQANSLDGEVHFFEIKTDTPKNNIRQAIGQLFEYSLFPESNKADRLIVIGDEEPSKAVKNYIKHLRFKTKLKLFYRWVDMDKNTLSPEI
jgi:hypothetical protein